MDLTEEQRRQVEMQLENHLHDSYRVNIPLCDGFVLRDFEVHKGVFRPDVTSAIHLAQWLYQNRDSYPHHTVIDIGCGTGLQGIVAGLAEDDSFVLFTDISKAATVNTDANAAKYLRGSFRDANYDTRRHRVEIGDLFERVDIQKPADLIIFNHPFFPADPDPKRPVSGSMLGGEELFQRFLREARMYLKPDGCIITAFYHPAGDTNNPSVHAPKHGYKVIEHLRKELTAGLQQGTFSIYELRRK